MNKMIEVCHELNLRQINTIIFAGGGNRCWWQSGAMAYLLEHCGWRMPQNIIGTSAGAGVATSLVLRTHLASLEACEELYSKNSSIFDKTESRGFLRFAHQHIYPAWLDSIVTSSNHHELANVGSKIYVAIARPSKYLGFAGSIIAGTLAYMVDKYISHKIHPTLALRLGLRMEPILLNDTSNIDTAKNILIAAAAVPPFQQARVVNQRIAIDGGYVDNVPLFEKKIGEETKTLVLLTRHYPKLPHIFNFNGRTYWQASKKIPVSTWDCTKKTKVRDAFNLGLRDAQSIFQNYNIILP